MLELGQAHPLARHIGDFLTNLADAGASGHTLRAYGEIQLNLERSLNLAGPTGR